MDELFDDVNISVEDMFEANMETVGELTNGKGEDED